jgi:transposase
MCPAFVVRLMAAYRAPGSLAAKPEGGWRYSKLDPNRELLIRRMTEKDDLTMTQLASQLLALGTKVTPASVSRRFIGNGYRSKESCGQANKSAPTCVKRASPGAPGASRACNRGPAGSSVWMKPAPRPR